MPIFFFYGEDAYSHRKKLSHWQAEFEKKYGDFNVMSFEGKTAKAGDILDAAQSVPFLSEKRFIVVRNMLGEGDSDIAKSLTESLDTIPDFTILVFSELLACDKRLSLYKWLIKHAEVKEFPLMTPAKITGWIMKEVETRGGVINGMAATELAERTAGDLYQLENEVVKLIAYARSQGGREITKKDVELLVGLHPTTSVFRLTDAIGQKRTSQALSQLDVLIQSGEELHGILYMIMRQLRIITAVKQLMERGAPKDEIVGTLGEHPFVISTTMQQSGNYSLKQLAAAYESFITFDTKLKSGGIKILTGDQREFVLALNKLVVDLCR
ncbi:DNA polymerase III subunit delta [Candidatus Gracilibacteria bacterium]|nr:DNA polymerase III subunit delta [Candidatus Gracilibacteria bacterium]